MINQISTLYMRDDRFVIFGISTKGIPLAGSPENVTSSFLLRFRLFGYNLFHLLIVHKRQRVFQKLLLFHLIFNRFFSQRQNHSILTGGWCESILISFSLSNNGWFCDMMDMQWITNFCIRLLIATQ
jgi:hypothetical protein